MWFLYIISIIMLLVGIFPTSDSSNVFWLLGGLFLFLILLFFSISKRTNKKD